MRVLVIGAGERTRAVLGRLGDRWEVVVIDSDGGRLERAATVRPITTVQGDPSSRIVLRRAGLTEADAVVVASLDDEVGLEVCRFATEAGVARVVALAAELDNLPAYRKLGVPAFSAAQLAARHVEINLEPRRVASAAFADGQAEAVEFRISPDSPLRGRSLSELGLSRWLVAAVLRNGILIVPNGRTVLETDDLVTVVGSAADYGAMVATFTSGQAHFPLSFGKQAAALLGDGADAERVVREAAGFVRATAAEALLLIHEDAAQLDDAKAKALSRRLAAVAEAHPNVEIRPTPSPETGLAALETAATRRRRRAPLRAALADHRRGGAGRAARPARPHVAGADHPAGRRHGNAVAGALPLAPAAGARRVRWPERRRNRRAHHRATGVES